MQSVGVEMKRDRLLRVYKVHGDDIYRICLHFTRNEKKAKDITKQVFVELYQEMDEVDYNHVFAYLVRQAKRLSTKKNIHEFTNREARL